MVDQRAEPVRPHVLADRPVTEAGVFVAARAEPPVVEHEPLDTDACRPVGDRAQPVEVVVEVDGLPHVERDELFGRVRGERALPGVRRRGEVVEAVAGW